MAVPLDPKVDVQQPTAALVRDEALVANQQVLQALLVGSNRQYDLLLLEEGRNKLRIITRVLRSGMFSLRENHPTYHIHIYMTFHLCFQTSILQSTLWSRHLMCWC